MQFSSLPGKTNFELHHSVGLDHYHHQPNKTAGRGGPLQLAAFPESGGGTEGRKSQLTKFNPISWRGARRRAIE
jgi:hypothetical protein